MQKSEGVVTLSNEDKVQYLIGEKDIEIAPVEIFSDHVGNFLDDLSRVLRGNVAARQFPDIQTFAFWIRKANFHQLKERADKRYQRIGRGLVFHIAPSNVPINFAYSLVFGMMSGNANIIRVSSTSFPQVDIICQCIDEMLKNKYKELQQHIAL